jgi:AcrR family transcriptional regulator
MAKKAIPSEDVRSRILAETLAHVRRYGRERVRVTSVARTLKMSHANVYRYFDSKDAIFDEIVRTWLGEADAVIAAAAIAEGGPAQRLRRVVTELNAFLTAKLRKDRAAIEVFRHAFEQQSLAVAEHVTRLKLSVAAIVADLSGSDQGSLHNEAVLMELLSTVLEPYLNPLLVHDRKALNDQQQINLLLDLLLVGLAASGRPTVPTAAQPSAKRT